MKNAQSGFTLLEVLFVVVILGVLAQFAMPKLITPGTLTLPAQAQNLADLVRQAQSLAVVRGQRMSVTASTTGSNGTVSIACVSGSCTTDTSLTVEQGVFVGSAGALYFDSLGRPVDSAGTPRSTAAIFTLNYTTGSDTDTATVTVDALTGRVTVNR